MLVWQSYTTDMGRAYPMFPILFRQENETSSNLNIFALLPESDRRTVLDVKHSCRVGGLTGRQIKIFAADGARYSLTYYQPFNRTLENYLTNNLNVVAYEWIGERLKYGRLHRMLENV